MDNDLDVGGMNVFVGFDKVCRKDGTEKLGWGDGMLLRHDVGSLFHGIGSDHDAVVGLRVAIFVSLGSMCGVPPVLTMCRFHPVAARRRSSRRHLVLLSPHFDVLYKPECCLCHTGLRPTWSYLLLVRSSKEKSKSKNTTSSKKNQMIAIIPVTLRIEI